MQFGQAAHQRQAEARAARLAVEAVVHLVEGLEDVVDLFARMPGPLSRTMIWKSPLRARPPITSMRPPSGVNLTALDTRLIRICFSARSSA